MKNTILIFMLLFFISCSNQVGIEDIQKVDLPKNNKDKNYITLRDDGISNGKYILTRKSYMKPYEDSDTNIKNIHSGDRVLSSILNITRASSDDKFGILQSDKIFSNLINLEYLELPISNSNITLSLLELKDGERESRIKIRDLDDPTVTSLHIEYTADSNISGESIDLNEKECKYGTVFNSGEKGAFHDRAMVSIFAPNDSSLTGFTIISKKDNFKLRYVTACETDKDKYPKKSKYIETNFQIKREISRLIQSETDIVSMSIGLFDDNNTNKNSMVSDFFKEEIGDKNSTKLFDNCIENDNSCSNDKFIWVISLRNIKADSNQTIESTNNYKNFHHTKFITTVTSVVDDVVNKIEFKQEGQRFKRVNKDKENQDEVDYFAINLPEKTLLAYEKKELEFRKASTSYATAIFSAIVYNLYSLNPYLNEKSVTRLLKDTAYNSECKDINAHIDYDIGGNKKEHYKIECLKHEPAEIGYIVNLRKAYTEAIKQLIERHNKVYYGQNNIDASLYKKDFLIDDIKVLDVNDYRVKKIKISDKKSDFINANAEIIGDVNISFSKEKVVCKYKLHIKDKNSKAYERTLREVIIKYSEDGKAYIFKENIQLIAKKGNKSYYPEYKVKGAYSSSK